MTMSKWSIRADVEDGVKPGVSDQRSAESQVPEQRIRLLEQEGEVLGRTSFRACRGSLPRKDSTRSRVSSLPMGFPVEVSCRVLTLAHDPARPAGPSESLRHRYIAVIVVVREMDVD